MNKIITIIFGIFILILLSSCNKEMLLDADKYCVTQGGKIENNIVNGKEVKSCFINDGVDGIRCDVDLFLEKKCGSDK